jgi:hypothetical protein
VKSILTAARPRIAEPASADARQLAETAPDDSRTDPNYAAVANEVSQTHGALSTQL